MTENHVTAVDSLIANEFGVELDGETLTGIFRVDGLVTFKLTVSGGESSMDLIHEPFRITKMVQRDGNNSFNKWLRETVNTPLGHSRPRRELAVVAVDDGVETRRWTAKGAWISQVAYSAFDSASSEMVEETVTIHYDSLEETWSATPNLE